MRSMLKRSSWTLVLVGSLVSPRPATAQAESRATAADSAAVLVQAAEEFATRGEPEVAAALYRLVVRRFPDLPVARLAESRLSEARLARSSSSGSTELTVWSTLYGLWLGAAVPAMLEADNSEVYGAGLLLGGPAGFLAGRRSAQGRALSLGQARAITWGGTWGTWQGLGWAMALDLDFGTTCSGDVCDESAQAVFGSMVAGGVAGIVVGNMLSKRDITDGLATTVNLGSLWGTWFGLATGILANLENDGLWTSALIGGNVGLLTTALAGPGWNPTRSRARIVSIAGIIGGLGGAGIDLLLQPGDDRTLVAIPLATSIAGLFIGAARTRDRADRSEAEPAASPPSSGALLNLSGGHLRVGAPLPGVLSTTPPGGQNGLALSIPLLSVRF